MADDINFHDWLRARFAGPNPKVAAVEFMRVWFNVWEQEIPPAEIEGQEGWGRCSLRAMCHHVSDALTGTKTTTDEGLLTDYLSTKWGPLLYHSALRSPGEPIEEWAADPDWKMPKEIGPFNLKLKR